MATKLHRKIRSHFKLEINIENGVSYNKFLLFSIEKRRSCFEANEEETILPPRCVLVMCEFSVNNLSRPCLYLFEEICLLSTNCFTALRNKLI